jgi:hypothetical protein
MNAQELQAFKGAGFKAMLRAITTMHGEAGLKKVLAGASPELKSLTIRKVLDNEWIPDKLGTELMVSADRVLGQGDYSQIRKISYFVAKDNLTGIYKIYVKMTSINGLLKRADQIWKQYFSTGTVKTLLAEPNHFQFEVLDYIPYPDTCIGVLGWLDMFMEVYKRKGVASHPECKLKGHSRCLFDIKLE